MATSRTKPLWTFSAQDVVKKLKSGTITPLDAVEEALLRIESTNAEVNAMCAVYAEKARARALSVSTDTLLAGLPIVVKDTFDVEGLVTTHGSKLWEQNVATQTDAIVAAIEANGGIVIGKTNTPEFAAGSNTFNDIFGTTSTPFDTRRTSGGSSGGTAAALACGQGWLGVGSDLGAIVKIVPGCELGGSLRIPASFCGVVGFRTSANLVQGTEIESETPEVSAVLRNLQAIDGPMARSVGDVALCMDAYAVPPLPSTPKENASPTPRHLGGKDIARLLNDIPGRKEPTPSPQQPLGGNRSWLECTHSGTLPNRILWTPDLGVCHVDPETVRVCKAAVDVLQRAIAGEHACVVTDCSADASAQERVSKIFSNAEHIFRTLRGYFFSRAFLDLPPLEPHDVGGTDNSRPSQAYFAHIAKAHPAFAQTVKPEVLWNMSVGLQVLSDHERTGRLLQHGDDDTAPKASAGHTSAPTEAHEQSGGDIDTAAANHRALLQGVQDLFADYDLLCTPCVVCPPFDKRVRYIAQMTCESKGADKSNHFSNYTEWLRMTYAITLTTAPALSLPVGFTEIGQLPIGLQIVGPPGGDAVVLRAAAVLERALMEQGFCTGVPRSPNATAASDITRAGQAHIAGPHTAADAKHAHAAELDAHHHQHHHPQRC